MAERLPVIRVRYTGLFDFEALYGAIIDWCKNYEYEWQEESYKHKVPNVKGAEQEWYWFANKDVTDYIHYHIDFYPRVWDMTEVEIAKDGKKKMLTSGRIEIVIIGSVELDWQKKFKGKWGERFGKWYAKIMRRDIEGIYIDGLQYRLWNLQAVMKKFFDMQTKWHEYKGYLKEN